MNGPSESLTALSLPFLTNVTVVFERSRETEIGLKSGIVHLQ